MKGPTHAIIGAALTYTLCKTMHLPFGYEQIGVAVLGSLLPDIDTEHSTIRSYLRKATIVAVPAAVYAYNQKQYTYLIMALLVAIVIHFAKHRGITHSLAACATLSAAFWGTRLFVPFAGGYLLHIICDMVNTKGVQLLFPLPNRYKYPLNFSTTSIPGIAIEVAVVIISVVSALLVGRF